MSGISSPVLMAENLDWGLVGSTVVTGLVVVFLILAVLVGFLWLFGKIFKAINERDTSKKDKKKAEIKPAVPAKPAAAPVTNTSVESSDDDEYIDEDDEEIIAVIAAAIAAYSAQDGKQYRITRIQRPKSARSGWSAAGVADNMRGFMN